jgi:hypothetical protein
MADAPETLWVDPSSQDDLNMYVGHSSDTMDYLNMDVEYTRAARCQALLVEFQIISEVNSRAQARIAELEAALQEIASYGNMNDKVGWAVQAARKALKLANDKGE